MSSYSGDDEKPKRELAQPHPPGRGFPQLDLHKGPYVLPTDARQLLIGSGSVHVALQNEPGAERRVRTSKLLVLQSTRSLRSRFCG